MTGLGVSSESTLPRRSLSPSERSSRGPAKILQIPMSFLDFHNSELVDQRAAVVASTFFNEWLAANPDALPLGPDRCVGYRVPLFLGGRDELANLEETDLWV